jgi:hypothetical protein
MRDILVTLDNRTNRFDSQVCRWVPSASSRCALNCEIVPRTVTTTRIHEGAVPCQICQKRTLEAHVPGAQGKKSSSPLNLALAAVSTCMGCMSLSRRFHSSPVSLFFANRFVTFPFLGREILSFFILEMRLETLNLRT